MLEVGTDLRSGEAFLPSITARSSRVMKLINSWYFLTRESELPVGPYASAAQAKKAAQQFGDFTSVADPSMTARCYEHLSKTGKVIATLI